jgi:hypothetical protein
MTRASTEPAVLFRIPDSIHAALSLPLSARSFVLLDDPTDTTAWLRARGVLTDLDAEAGTLLRHSIDADEEVATHATGAARKVATLARDLAAALSDLNARRP